MNYKLSIIVPVYNVEKYIRKCLQSLIDQTLSDYEVILVDDGSTDGSAEICKEFCNRDKRFKLFQKQNGGLSDARNYGLKYATGTYVGFVDSDDYIKKDMYMNLIKVADKYSADIVASKFLVGTDGGILGRKDTKKTVEFSGDEMIREYIFQETSDYYITHSVWDRIYKADLLTDIRFDKGRNYEDIVFSTLAFLKAKKCVYYDYSGYIYVLREGSIMNSNDIVQEYDDLSDQLKKRIKILKDNQKYDCAEKCSFEYFYYCVDAKCRFLAKEGEIKKKYIKLINSDLKDYRKDSVRYALNKKMYIKLITINSSCYFWGIYQFLKKVVEGKSVHEQSDYCEATGWTRQPDVSVCNGASH